MKTAKLREMTTDELEHEAGELRKALFNLRLKKAIGQLEKSHQLRATRRDLARVLTLRRQRGLSGAEPVGQVKPTTQTKPKIAPKPTGRKKATVQKKETP
jgi:large subunit ribosomal protein L29